VAAFAIKVSRRVVAELELDYGDDEELAIHVEGLESPGYAPCAIKGMGLAFAITDRAACHLRATVCKAEFAGLVPFQYDYDACHCEERSYEAIPTCAKQSVSHENVGIASLRSQ